MLFRSTSFTNLYLDHWKTHSLANFRQDKDPGSVGAVCKRCSLQAIIDKREKKDMEEIIAPISKEILKAELSEDKRLRFTNKSHNEIYVITYQDSPNVMKEIGRLREIAFRAAGGGTGKAMDIDEYDVMENPYKQLVVWNPEAEEILGGYRYLLGDEVQFDEHGKPVLATAHMFNFSEVFLKDNDNQIGRAHV